MDKFLHLGMSLPEVVRRTTEIPARFLGRAGELGTLKPGAIADITVLDLQQGQFSLVDSEGSIEIGNQHLEPTLVFRAGDQATVLPQSSLRYSGEGVG